MKNALIIILALSLPLTLAAQEQTLFGPGARVGGFGAPFFEINTMKGKTGVSGGAGGAVVVNDFFFGIYGSGTSYPYDDLPGDWRRINLGHGGFWLGYAPLSERLFHPYVDLRIGWGAVALSKNFEDEDFDFDSEADQLFALTPGAGVELNIFRWWRLAATVGYRWIDGIDPSVAGLSNDDFRSLTGNFILRFGGFGRKRE